MSKDSLSKDSPAQIGTFPQTMHNKSNTSGHPPFFKNSTPFSSEKGFVGVLSAREKANTIFNSIEYKNKNDFNSIEYSNKYDFIFN